MEIDEKWVNIVKNIYLKECVMESEKQEEQLKPILQVETGKTTAKVLTGNRTTC